MTVIGPNADEPRNQLGDYIPHVIPQPIVTVLEGIRHAVSPETKVAYVKGCEVIGDDQNDIAQAKTAAALADVAIVVLGENERRAPGRTATDGEGFDAATLELTGRQEELVEAVQKTGTPTVVVLLNGRPLATRWIAQYVPAVVEAWLPGEQGGRAVAEVLFGDVNPSGRLPVTVPRHAGQLPVYYNAKKSKIHWVKSGWGHPYVDMDPTPLYPFGYGLSYTQFEYGNLSLERTEIGPAQTVAVQFELRNTGNRSGSEVAQLYVQEEISSVSRPERELHGFTKVSLAPGETKTCRLTLRPEDLALYDQNLQRVVEPGKFKIMIGASSQDIRLETELTVRPQ